MTMNGNGEQFACNGSWLIPFPSPSARFPVLPRSERCGLLANKCWWINGKHLGQWTLRSTATSKSCLLRVLIGVCGFKARLGFFISADPPSKIGLIAKEIFMSRTICCACSASQPRWGCWSCFTVYHWSIFQVVVNSAKSTAWILDRRSCEKGQAQIKPIKKL